MHVLKRVMCTAVFMFAAAGIISIVPESAAVGLRAEAMAAAFAEEADGTCVACSNCLYDEYYAGCVVRRS